VDVLPSEPYVIKGRYPSPETVGRTYDEADLIRAVSMYRFFSSRPSELMIRGVSDRRRRRIGCCRGPSC
jgi:hypothetical protein